MAIRDFEPSSSPPSWQAAGREPAELQLRPFPDSAKPRLEPWRIASFSSLSSAAVERAPASRRIVETPDYVDPEVELELRETTPRGIFAFARGARAGSCLHEIFEKTDFARANGPDLESTVTEALAKYDFLEKAAHKGEIDPVRDVTDAVRTVLEVTLPGETFALSTVSRARKLSEWQFYLPMATVSAAGFADVLEKHGAKLASSEYAASLRALAGRGVEGFLTGFVDLVFMHDDRWFIVDWKSNHLGNDARAYDDTAIARAMREHHYVLQYHLYVVALHRYLRQRVPDYDYDRHMGGVYYVFLRGIRRDPKAGSVTGWYRDRPSRALVEALDSFVGGRT
jgi:exodeoxyribonuclease V beta subunit